MCTRIDINFEPTRETKECMIHSKNAMLNLGGVEKINIFGNNQDVSGVMTGLLSVFIFELIGLWFLYKMLEIFEFDSWYVPVLIILLGFIFDFIFTIIYHKYSTGKNQKLLLENQHIRITNGDNAQLLKNNREIKKRQSIALVWKILIIALAVLKIFGYIALVVPNSIDGESSNMFSEILFVIVLYSVIAYFHISNTGYAIFYLYGEMSKCKSDHNRFISNPNDPAVNSTLIFRELSKNFIMDTFPTEAQFGGNARYYYCNTDGKSRKFFYCFGLLLDDDIQREYALIKDNETKNEFRQIAISIQLEQINATFQSKK